MRRSAAPRVRVIASNLHVGGGVQVAASLLNEWARDEVRRTLPANLLCEVSPAVYENLVPKTRRQLPLVVRRRRPLSVRYWFSDLLHRDDATLVVFGPTYFPLRSKRRVYGYADVTSLYHPQEYGGPSRITRAQRARQWWSRRWIRGADVIVVESPALRDRLESVCGVEPARVHVIPNAVNGEVLRETGEWRFDKAPGEVLLAYPTRDYPHKNLEFLPELSLAASTGTSRTLRFVVTLTDQEWAARSESFRRCCINVGALPVRSIGPLLRGVDGVCFPSLLESFSATPIEAMALGVPLFASDRDFVRGICGDGATYFDPINAEAAAHSVVDALESGEAKQRAEDAIETVAALPTATSRAIEYATLLQEPARV